jgi:hypothetical protein
MPYIHLIHPAATTTGNQAGPAHITRVPSRPIVTVSSHDLTLLFPQVGDRTLFAELFQIVSERDDTKFKFLSISPKIYLSGTEATVKAQTSSGKVFDVGSYSGAVRPKGNKFIHAQVMLLVWAWHVSIQDCRVTLFCNVP